MHKVANKLRELVGPLPEIYTNEDDNIDAWDVVPKGLSMLSYDDYDNHNNNGSVELSRQWEYTHDVMLSRMWPRITYFRERSTDFRPRCTLWRPSCHRCIRSYTLT